MQDLIHLLPDKIANQIAAGEVVQRPASVVKELLENSIDAEATEIQLHIKDGGKSLIQVMDNGKGMSKTDARMCFERHATSKITDTEDLFKIKTMGFRGEALASIVAVAQLEMKTKRPIDELGTLIQINGSQLITQEPIATTQGTCITVKNLFYNVPARRNFLKTDSVEYKHIIDEFIRVALANYHVKFSLYNNNEKIYQLDNGKLSQRIIQLFNANYEKQLIPCEEEIDNLKIRGYIGTPEFAKKTRGEQFFFVNNRFVKVPYFNHSILQAYKNLISDDQFPFYVLFLDIDPQLIDINVHPTKTEIKFSDERWIYGILLACLKQTLAKFNVTPSLDFELDVNFDSILKSNFSPNNHSMKTEDRKYSNFQSIGDFSGEKKWSKLFEDAKQEDLHDIQQGLKDKNEIISSHINFQNNSPNDNTSLSPNKENENIKNCLQVHNKYIIYQVKSGIVIINLQAAQERILYENFVYKLKNNSIATEMLLFPSQVELNYSDIELVMGIKDEFEQLGFKFEQLGKNHLAINGLPMGMMGNASEQEIFESILEQYKNSQSKINIDKNEYIIKAISKKMSRKTPIFDQQEANSFIEKLFMCEQPNFTPDGMPTFIILSLEKISHLFT